MKEFFKLTKLKIGLAIGILAFHIIEGMLYNKILFSNLSPTGELGKINIVLKIIHYIFQTIFIPLHTAGDIFIKLGRYFFDNSDFLFDYVSIIGYVFLLLFIFYCYFLGCLFSFLIKKKRAHLESSP